MPVATAPPARTLFTAATRRGIRADRHSRSDLGVGTLPCGGAGAPPPVVSPPPPPPPRPPHSERHLSAPPYSHSCPPPVAAARPRTHAAGILLLRLRSSVLHQCRLLRAAVGPVAAEAAGRERGAVSHARHEETQLNRRGWRGRPTGGVPRTAQRQRKWRWAGPGTSGGRNAGVACLIGGGSRRLLRAIPYVAVSLPSSAQWNALDFASGVLLAGFTWLCRYNCMLSCFRHTRKYQMKRGHEVHWPGS